jgi:hypothetical protein
MTVGIGALCDRASCIILASDSRVSWPRNKIASHEESGKQWDFPFFSIAASVAGTLSSAQPLVDELTVQICGIAQQEKVYCEHFENAIDYARFKHFKKRVNWQFRRQLGVTWEQWITGKIPAGKLDPLALKAGLAIFEETTLPVQMIVGGFLKDGRLIFYKASEKSYIEQATSPGVYVIGSGAEVAMDRLSRRGQNVDCSIARSLLHIHEALDDARKADKYVGNPSAYFVIKKDGRMARFPADSGLLINLAKRYAKQKTTRSLQNSKVADEHVLGLMLPHVRRETEFVQ